MTARTAAADPCHRCGAPLDGDQRYCLECGTRTGSPRVDFLRELGLLVDGLPRLRPPGVAARARPSRRVAVALAAATLGAGAALGAALGPAPAPSQAGQPARLVALEQPATTTPAPAPAAAPASAGASSPSSSAPSADATSAASDPVSAADASSGSASDPSASPSPTSSTPSATPAPSATSAPAPATARIDHVWVIALSGQSFPALFGPDSPATYLAHELAAQGTVLSGYAPVAATALANGVALLSGQAPNDATLQGCATYVDVSPPAADAAGLVGGTGCVYPAATHTLVEQLSGAGRTWRAYVEGVRTACRHPLPGQADPWRDPVAGDAYQTARNPFVYFHSLLDSGACGGHDLDLERLSRDLATPAKTPSLSWIVPDACHDGGDTPCAPGAPAGPAAADAFLRSVVPAITATDAYRQGGLVVVVADAPGAGADPAAPPPATGALLLSPYVRAGATIAAPYGPYGVLRTLEDLFALPHLGHAGDATVAAFGDAIAATPAAAAAGPTS
jgi:hypothetical protein